MLSVLRQLRLSTVLFLNAPAHSKSYDFPSLACALPFSIRKGNDAVLKISICEDRNQHRLILEGKLIGPWAAELKAACDKAKADLSGRELIVEMRNLTAISQEGENLLLGLLNEGIKLRCRGVFTKLILKQLVRRARANMKEAKR